MSHILEKYQRPRRGIRYPGSREAVVDFLSSAVSKTAPSKRSSTCCEVDTEGPLQKINMIIRESFDGRDYPRA